MQLQWRKTISQKNERKKYFWAYTFNRLLHHMLHAWNIVCSLLHFIVSIFKSRLQNHDLPSLFYRVWFYVSCLLLIIYFIVVCTICTFLQYLLMCYCGSVSNHLGPSALVNLIWFDIFTEKKLRTNTITATSKPRGYEEECDSDRVSSLLN